MSVAAIPADISLQGGRQPPTIRALPRCALPDWTGWQENNWLMTFAFDDHLDAVLIGGREKRSIVIVDYDPRWPALFAELAGKVRGAVGNRALMVEHIGSTAVPHLAAKPIIDILLTVANVADEAVYLPQLEDAGFILRVREQGHRMFRTAGRDVHIHVLSSASEAVPAYLKLRDWLRRHENDRMLYAETKKTLALEEWADMNYYADAKTAVISAILRRAHRLDDQH